MSLTITMPIYNEVEGISDFIEELWDEFKHLETRYVLVNDCSTDQTLRILFEIQETYGDKVQIVDNNINLGHGRSTLLGMRKALSYDSSCVITIDGDGQFQSSDVFRLYQTFSRNNLEILEGSRHSREDPFYRKFSTTVTRLLILARTGKLPKDANTPLRIYQPQVLARILNSIPTNTLIPNLHISAFTRKFHLKFDEEPIKCGDRRGVNKVGTTWNNKFSFLPSKRFLKFCFLAVREWILVRP